MKKIFLSLILFLLFSCGGNSGEVRLNTINNHTIISWDEPTTNVDGSPLTDLEGYKVYWGISSGIYSNVLDIGRPLSCGNFPSITCNYSIDFMNGHYYIVLTAYDTSGNESDYSNEVFK